MIIEIQGAWLRNHGAGLMYRTVLDRIATQRPGWSIAMNSTWGSRDARRDAQWTVAPRGGRAGRILLPVHHLADTISPPATRLALRSAGRIGPGDADALLDISGFAISDQWPLAKMQDRVSAMERFAEQGKPVVVLPQAFGPLETPASRAVAARLVEAARLVYARDATSLRALLVATGPSDHISQAPDLTFASPAPVRPTGRLVDRVAIVPNERLCDQGSLSEVEYIDALTDAVMVVRRTGRGVAIVLHSRDEGDRRLASLLATRIGVSDEPIDADDPQLLKAELGTAHAVVGSRFHALLGALSQGVPCIAIGWSHKYLELMDEMGQRAWIVAPEQVTAQLGDRVSALLEQLHRRDVRVGLTARADEKRRQLDGVWAETFSVLDRCSTVSGSGLSGAPSHSQHR